MGVVTRESELSERVNLSGVGHVEVRDTWHLAVICLMTYGIGIRGVFYRWDFTAWQSVARHRREAYVVVYGSVSLMG